MSPSRSALCGLLAAFLLSGCGDGLTAPTGEPDYVGYIVDMSVNSAFVKALDDPCGLVLALGPNTYYGASGKAIRRELLTPGLLAQVWVDGDIDLSCPGQAAARAITVG